jgi:DHA2 family methylenomycin A resistance protein-like MFS transporter
MLLALRSAGETARGHARPLDLVGQILAVLLLGSLATAVIASGRQPTREVAVLAAGAALIAGVAFVVAQHRREERAMLPLRLFRSPTYRVMTGVGLLINVGFYGLIFLLSLEFQQVRHASALQTGLAFAPTTVAVGVGNLASGRLAARYGATRVVAGGAAVSAIGYVGLLLAGPTAPYATLVSPLVVLGGGLGVLVPAMTSALLGAAPLNLSGVASGTLNTARQTGSALGVSLFGALATRGISAGLRTSLVLCVTASLLVTALAARLSRV